MNILAFDDECWRLTVVSPRYEVSDMGRVRSNIGSRKIIRASVDSRGRHRIELRARPNKPRKFFVATLVLEAFVGPRPDGLVACHEDDDPYNNVLSNLRWDTQSSNIADSWRNGRQGPGLASPGAKLTRAQVLEIRAAPRGVTATTLASRLGMSVAAICKVRKGQTYVGVGNVPSQDTRANSKLTKAQVAEVRNAPKSVTSKSLAEKFGMSNSALCSARRGDTYTEV